LKISISNQVPEPLKFDQVQWSSPCGSALLLLDAL
jgi:hypothetical protein